MHRKALSTLALSECGTVHSEPITPPTRRSDGIERNVWELHRMHVAGACGTVGTGDDKRLPLTASGVVQAARQVED